MMKLRKSTVLPLALLAYLAAMCYIGRGELAAGHYLYYFGVIGATLIVIALLRYTLLRRERIVAERRRKRHAADSNK